MRSVSRNTSWVAALGLALAIWLGGSPSFADPVFDAGVKLYSAKNYRGAAQQFEKALQTQPSNPNVLYYCALSHYMSNNGARARQLFQYLSDNFGSTQQGQLARSVLARTPGAAGTGGQYPAGTYVAPTGGSQAAGGGDDDDNDAGDDGRSRGFNTERWLKNTTSAAEVASLPTDVRIPFVKDRDGIKVNVLINNQVLEMIVDTGAPVTVVGENHMAQLGISRPAAKGVEGKSVGVGSRVSNTWSQACDLKVGGLYRKNFPIVIQDNLPCEGLLGQTFFAPYSVTVDTQNSQLVLKKKGSGGATSSASAVRDPYAIPFRWSGGHMIVNTLINNKPCEVIFDTGAGGVCTFAVSQLKKLNIEIPSDYRKERHSGVGGDTMGYGFQVDSIKLGPIVQYSPWISAVEDSHMDRPLLGQQFFGEYTYSIDSENKLIHFKKQ